MLFLWTLYFQCDVLSIYVLIEFKSTVIRVLLLLHFYLRKCVATPQVLNSIGNSILFEFGPKWFFVSSG